MRNEQLHIEAIQLLKQLIATPSFSKEEHETADHIAAFFHRHGIACERIGNNLFCKNKYYDPAKPTLLLNSHHDTVKPASGYTRNPFEPAEADGKLFGLGSNDAGGCLVSLIACFLHFYEAAQLSHNIVLAASAEEEISGKNGIELVLPQLGKIDFGIVGEPTQMEMAVAERGLLVIDCAAPGRAGHAARNEGDNAIYHAMRDIGFISNYKFEKISDLLGPTRMSVTVINTDNAQHNVVPSSCRFVIDVRINELYSFEEVLELLQQNLKSSFQPRSTRMRSTSIALSHPLVQAGLALGRGYYGSPTTSDKALMPFSTVKMGPGDSARSHTADEFIFIDEIKNGIDLYIQMVGAVCC